MKTVMQTSISDENKLNKLSNFHLKTVIPLVVEQIIISLDRAIHFLLEGISIGSSADRVLEFIMIPLKKGDTFVAKIKSFLVVCVQERSLYYIQCVLISIYLEHLFE